MNMFNLIWALFSVNWSNKLPLECDRFYSARLYGARFYSARFYLANFAGESNSEKVEFIEVDFRESQLPREPILRKWSFEKVKFRENRVPVMVMLGLPRSRI